MGRLPELIRQNPYLRGCTILQNSDAHQLGDIKEPGQPLEVEKKSVEGIIAALLKEDFYEYEGLKLQLFLFLYGCKREGSGIQKNKLYSGLFLLLLSIFP